jgi:hypothetical protein
MHLQKRFVNEHMNDYVIIDTVVGFLDLWFRGIRDILVRIRIQEGTFASFFEDS